MPPSPIRKLAPFAESAKRRGVHVYHLNIGQPDIETPAVMRDRLLGIKDRVLAYTPSGGTDKCIAAFEYYYRSIGITLRPGELLVTTGGSEACMFAFMACADPGDELLVVEPFYSNYSTFAALGDIRLAPVVSRGEDGFHLPPIETWHAALTERTRAVVICNPNNPTGTVYTRSELEMVAAFCRTHSLFLICDEVYREFSYAGGEVHSALMLPQAEPFVIVVDSVSKRYSACGIRLGCLITRNREIQAACLRMAQGRLSAPGLAQVLAEGIEHLSPDFSSTMISEFERRRDVLYEGLCSIDGVFLRKPEGAFYLMPRLPVRDSEAFCQWMLSEFEYEGATVMMAPAPGFYATPGLGRNEVRIAYVLNEHDLRKSVEVLRHGLAAYASLDDKV